jgi:retron-type reverse transcriptase
MGVHQGDVLSPNLFKIFINDITDSLNSRPTQCSPASLLDHKLMCLMYADDIVLLSESASGLQNSLNALKGYCSNWGLNVNQKKTKIMIFNI